MDRSTMRQARHAIEYLAVRGAIALAGSLPRRQAAAVGAVLGDFAYRVIRIRRRVVEDNLRRTLGQFAPGDAELARIARATYRHLGGTLVEYGRLRRLDTAGIAERVELVGLEHFASAAARGRGVILLTGHFGSFELMGAAVAARGYRMHFLAKPQRNQLVERYLNRTRAHLGVGLVHPGLELRRAIRCLRRGEVLGMLADQDAGADGIFIDFLGRTAAVQTGPAVLALRTGAAIVPACIVRGAGGRQRAVFEAPLVADPDADAAGEVERLVRAYTASLERFILRYPEHWYWVHRRWKTRPAPDGERSSTDGSSPPES